MAERGYYFGAGPACLPEAVLRQAQDDLWNWGNQGVSILELGFRTQVFMDLMAETEELFRQLLSIPKNFSVLFIGGAARGHFAHIPRNLLSSTESAAYIASGTWSTMAFDEASRLLPQQTYLIGNNAGNDLRPPVCATTMIPNTKYLYFCPNETISGLSFMPGEDFKPGNWVADMTSCLLTDAVDFSAYGLIFAGAQKNIANAGLTLVIVRDDFLAEKTMMTLPLMEDYRLFIQEKSLYATPPTFNIYLMNSMLKWMQSLGGIPYFQDLSMQKSKMIYDFLDHSSMFHSYVQGDARSKINITFTTHDKALDLEIIQAAEKQGLYGLKGHRRLGGLRASLYNPMPLAGVQALLQFLQQF